MLRLSSVFLVIALAAALLGFGGITNLVTTMAQSLFFISLIIFLISLLAGAFRRI